ncbi:MAG: CehA/McbA family metallohydrolase [Anaerolineae bacterium]
MTWTSPFSLSGHWLKGNLHTHTTQSDGDLTPDQAIDWYRDHGYDFIAITDHWVLTPGQTRSPGGFFTIAGAEVDGPLYHLLCLGLSALPSFDLRESAQDLVDAVVAAGGLPYFAHPYWTAQTPAHLAGIQGFAGIEVFNSVCDRMDGLGYAGVHWDLLLATRRSVTGLAVDDTHWRHGEIGRGFVMVRAAERSERAILEALRQGHFYASTGPQISALDLTEDGEGRPALRVRCSPCQSITFFAHGPRGHRYEATDGLLDGAVHPLSDAQVFLRVECRDSQGRIAWSNPIFMDQLLES